MDESDAPQIEVQNIDHLGIVAGIVDEIGLVEQIDELLGTHSQEHISSGQAVKAMILKAWDLSPPHSTSLRSSSWAKLPST
jgi:hypothetical protein